MAIPALGSFTAGFVWGAQLTPLRPFDHSIAVYWDHLSQWDIAGDRARRHGFHRSPGGDGRADF